MSPWGPDGVPPLGAFVAKPDLAKHVAELDREAEEHGLSLVEERTLELPPSGVPAVLRTYAGTDAVGRATHAVRVATRYGIVLAVGPLRDDDVLRHEATELVWEIAPDPERADAPIFRSLSDLTGNGAADVILRSERGELVVWQLGERAAVRLVARLEVLPTRALDVDGSGRIALGGVVPPTRDDPIAPRLEDFATFDGVGFTHEDPPARARHRQLAAALRVPPRREPPAARAKRALEASWHAVLAGEELDEVLEELDEELPRDPALARAFKDHRRRIFRIGK